MTKPEAYILQGIVRHYDWGHQGPCLVRELAGPAAGLPPYAELWFGTHPKAPAQITNLVNSLDLGQIIRDNPLNIIGESALRKHGSTLPFLFKILSIAEPLSIQAHPDLELARGLHRKDSVNYPDDNHKPEIAIALSRVELLAGVRPQSEVLFNIANTPELARLLSQETIDMLSDQATTPHSAVLSVFKELLSTEAAVIKDNCERLYSRLERSNKLDAADEVVLRLKQYYPQGDIGLFFIYILNLIRLNPMEAVFFGPNTPHAYLSGELAECMTCSDNVVRVGLTNKFKDVPTLLEMIERLPNTALFRHYPVISGQDTAVTHMTSATVNIISYPVFTPEFTVSLLEGCNGQLSFRTNDSPMLLVNISGTISFKSAQNEYELQTGQAVLIPTTCGDFTLFLSNSRVFQVTYPNPNMVRALV